MKLYMDEMFNSSLWRCSTRLPVVLDIFLRKANTGQKRMCLIGQKVWSKINPRIKNVKTTAFCESFKNITKIN